jgi:hypothetical protein
VNDAATIRIPGAMGPRAWAFAFQVAERMRWLGEVVGEHEIVCRKPRHARDIEKLQVRDRVEGLVS